MVRYLLIIATAASLVACGSTAEWRRPGWNAEAGPSTDGLTMALAECEGWARGTAPAPIPPAYIPVPAPTSYLTRGTYSQYGSTGTFQATTRARSSFDSQFASGYNSGAALGSALASMVNESKVTERTEACMREMGWVDTSTPEGVKKLEVATAAFQEKKRQRELQNAAKSQETEQQNKANERWLAAIETFIDAEAARPDGIDYLANAAQFNALDTYVKMLANRDENDDKPMSWFLIEANKLVRKDYGLNP